MASSGGKPKPSYNEGKIKERAPLYKVGKRSFPI
jgi:hypothetical protein